MQIISNEETVKWRESREVEDEVGGQGTHKVLKGARKERRKKETMLRTTPNSL